MIRWASDLFKSGAICSQKFFLEVVEEEKPTDLENGCSNGGGDDGEVGLCGNDTFFCHADNFNVLRNGRLFTIVFFFKHFTTY